LNPDFVWFISKERQEPPRLSSWLVARKPEETLGRGLGFDDEFVDKNDAGVDLDDEFGSADEFDERERRRVSRVPVDLPEPSHDLVTPGIMLSFHQWKGTEIRSYKGHWGLG